jgi:hypothetical protein
MRWHHLVLALAHALACFVDASLTLKGQSPAYWAGETTTANELSPEPRKLLSISPWLFIIAVAGWIASIGFIAVDTPRPFTTVFACCVTMGHVVSAATWTLWSSPYGYQISMLFQIVCGTILACSIDSIHARSDILSPFRLFPAYVYRVSVCGLLIAIIYMFLVPH